MSSENSDGIKRVLKGTRELPIDRKADSWVPISVAAYIQGCSRVKVFKMMQVGAITGLKYPASPILVNLAEIFKAFQGNKHLPGNVTGTPRDP